MSPHPSANFKIQKYYQNKPRVNSIQYRDNLSKTKFNKERKGWGVCNKS